MRPKLLQLLILIFSGLFLLLLGLLILTQQDKSIDFQEGFSRFEESDIQITQSSQTKETIIKQLLLSQKPKGRPSTHNPPDSPHNQTDPKPPTTNPSTKNPVQLLHDYERKLDLNYLWGTYKPHLIHAITQRSPKPLTFGMMYVATESGSQLTHTYRDIKLQKQQYSEYLAHDGKSYSESVFKDSKCSFEIHNHFYKERLQEEKQRWHSVTKKERSGSGFLNNKASLIYYFMIEDFDYGTKDDRYLELDPEKGVIKVRSLGDELRPSGYFKIVVYDKNDRAVPFQEVEKFIHIDANIAKKDTWRVQEILQRKMVTDPTVKFRVVPNNYQGLLQSQNSNLIAVQLVLDPYASFAVHVIYDKSGGFENVEDNFHRTLGITKYSKTLFEPDYERAFYKANIDPSKYTCGASALSNLLSGIGYYHGDVMVSGQGSQPQPKLALYTGTPSKTEFPRGFLWDEGFHGLVYCKWSTDICIDVLRSWMGTQLDNGWIPREQLRGEESKSNGHPDYLVQIKDEANPPTLMFNVMALLEAKEKGQLPEGASEMLNVMYPKLKKWFEWFYTSQASDKEEGLFIWKSNNQNRDLVMGSGLDDYPRGLAGGSKSPRGHLDLHVWMIFMAETMEKLAENVGKPEDVRNFGTLLLKLRNNLAKFVDPMDQIYKDLVQDRRQKQKEFSPHFGYVNLFPLFFGYIEKDSKSLDKLLDYMKSNIKIWSAYGLLSLARDDSLYMKTNDAYWGGPIWINMNYLALRGLKLYYYDNNLKARRIYEDLRNNLIRNICYQKETKGYFFEQFNQDSGNGQKNYPFTGWTTTVLNIIYEKY